MAGNRFGDMFSFTTFGESHGPAIGCVVDGVPPGINLCEDDIQPWLERRRGGQSRFTTPRAEADKVRILSGVFEGKTTGTSIGLLIENESQQSRDYADIAQRYRPGHADFTYQEKYGIRDYRGGGRASARETAMRVAAGAIARKVLDSILGSVTIRGALTAMGTKSIDPARWDWSEVEANPFWCPDAIAAKEWEAYLSGIKASGSSIGGVVTIIAEGAPVGLGEPVYDRLDADLAKALMSINAVKGVEIGDGFAAAQLRGEENGDEMRMADGKPVFLSNHAGGVLGGVSTGQPIIARIAIKPTSSIMKPMRSIDQDGNEIDLVTKGRHDPCVAIRAVPVAEAMVAATLADHLLRYRGQTGIQFK